MEIKLGTYVGHEYVINISALKFDNKIRYDLLITNSNGDDPKVYSHATTTQLHQNILYNFEERDSDYYDEKVSNLIIKANFSNDEVTIETERGLGIFNGKYIYSEKSTFVPLQFRGEWVGRGVHAFIDDRCFCLDYDYGKAEIISVTELSDDWYKLIGVECYEDAYGASRVLIKNEGNAIAVIGKYHSINFDRTYIKK